jgi:hypothetical protein
MMTPGQPSGGINPGMLSEMMPHLLTFAAGAGFKELVSNFEKIHKLMGAGSEHAQQPGGPQQAAPAGAQVPQNSPQPDQLQLLMRLLQARQAAGGM